MFSTIKMQEQPRSRDISESSILIFSEDSQCIADLGSILSPHYRLRIATNHQRVFELLDSFVSNLLIFILNSANTYSTQSFSNLNTYCRNLRIPIFVIDLHPAENNEIVYFNDGAADYLSAPINETALLVRINRLLLNKAEKDSLIQERADLISALETSMKENELIHDISIRTLANLAETRDNDTGKHIIRTSLYVKTLAEILQKNPLFKHKLSDRTINILAKSAPLHDIGKVGIPDSILLKPGKLNDEEWQIMKTHAALGANAIERASKELNAPGDFLQTAKEIARWHHEHWDGSGYPDGLKWDEIPLSAKLMAIADVFDALVFPRVYKRAFTFDEAKELMTNARGKQFDPELLDAFLNNFEKFTEIALLHQDEQHS
jgi:putative two-component system response regulator